MTACFIDLGTPTLRASCAEPSMATTNCSHPVLPDGILEAAPTPFTPLPLRGLPGDVAMRHNIGRIHSDCYLSNPVFPTPPPPDTRSSSFSSSGFSRSTSALGRHCLPGRSSFFVFFMTSSFRVARDLNMRLQIRVRLEKPPEPRCRRLRWSTGANLKMIRLASL